MLIHQTPRAPERIAVLRALQLGDLLCAVPAFRALRRAFPSAQVALIGLPWAEELLRRYPAYLDELIVFPGFPGVPEQELRPELLGGFFDAVQARDFDLAIQLHGSGITTNAFVALLGARRTLGFALPQLAPPLDQTIPYPDHLPEVERHLALLRAGGIPADDPHLEFPLTDADRSAAARLVDGGLPAAYACLHPGARDAQRRWPAERFAAVGDALADAGLTVLITGSVDEMELAAAVRAAMRAPAIDLAGRTSLGSLGALLDGARLLVSNDTGVAHLADALDVPSVVIFSGAEPARWGPLDTSLHRALGGPVPDVIEHCCVGEACVLRSRHWREVSVREAIDTANELLGEERQHAA